MARYETRAAAEADGFSFAHDREANRFIVSIGDEIVGFAHYSLLSEGSVIDFNHTEVVPRYRGTGISGILATEALTDDIAQERSIRTSCWFMDGFLASHPELIER